LYYPKLIRKMKIGKDKKDAYTDKMDILISMEEIK
jgi:hypothetical protein